MNRGEGTTPPATKSGRKVKRPAHFDDSPDPASPGKVKKEVATAAPESVKKTARRTLAMAGTPPSKNGSDSESGEGAGKKSARRTLAKNGSREESPEPEVKKAAPASARKTLLKSAVQNSSAEGGTPKKTPAKKAEPEQDSEAGPGLSRTGRKIKVPAHLKEFEDVIVPAVTGRKSVAPKKEEPEAVPKSATKAKTIVRQLATEHEEEKPQPKTPAKVKQARKAAEEEEEEETKPVTKTPGRARSVARKTAEEEEVEKPVTKTPGRARSVARKTAEEEEDTKPAPKARGRSVARKASVDEPTPFEEKPAPKTYGRARSVARQTEEDEKPKSPTKPVEAPKTPGRTKAVPRRFAEDEDELKSTLQIPSRAKSMAARKPSIDEPAQPSKTPSRRAKSIAPQSKPEEEADPLALPEEPPKPQSPPKKQPTKTPSKPRAKSDARDPSPEPPQKSDPSEPAPTSRSGRKIKPKKYFGEFEQDESVPAVVPTAAATKVAATSPVKSPRVVVASPVRSPQQQQQIVKKGSPYAPMKDLPVVVAKATTTTPPVKRLSVPEKKSPAATVVVPTKKAKKDDADGEGSPFKISPATEERQITKRNVNDHHHQMAAASKPDSPKVVVVKVASSPVATKSVSPPKKAKLDSPKPVLPAVTSEPELLSEQDPLASSSTSTSSVAPTESSEATTPPAPPKEVEDKPKRGRKTLPAGPSSDDSSDVLKPKTPGRKTMAPIVTPAASLEEPGSSRSGRKIKPKKFFDDGEPATASAVIKATAAAKVKPEVATPAGRGGKRKTIVPKEDKDEKEEKKDEPEVEPEVEEKKEEPIESVSREEIMAIVGDFGEVAASVVEPAAAVDTPAEAEPMNGTPEETSDTATVAEPTTTTTVDETAAAVVDQPAAADPIEEPAAATVEPAEPEPQDASDAATATDAHDQVAEASAGNFPETPIEQTPPIAASEPETKETEKATEEPTTAPTVPDDPAVSAEAPEPEPEPAVAEQSASSAFSEALVVEEESTTGAAPAAGGPTVEQKMEELFESVEFLEESSGRLSDVMAAAAAVTDGVPAELLEQQLGEVMDQPEVPVEEPVQDEETEDLDKTEPPSTLDEPTLESVQQEEEEEEDLNKTEPPAALNDTVEDDGQNQEEDLLATSMPDNVDEFFAENDRSQESITVLPETPKQKPELEHEDLDLIGKLPEPQQSSSNTVAFVEIPAPATPKTPESKPVISKDDYSPDKPDAQELASEPQELQLQAPPEIIEIFDSPVVVATAVESTAEKQATSTPVGGPSSKLTVKERLIQNSRKRSLSASDADLSTKKNVTFHSPANSTILVDTLDERLKKSLKEDSKSKTARKRSLSEHKEMGPVVDGPKPSKISKLPNFKNIHQNQFSRMESIAEYHNRKVQRAKEILTSSASKSPAKGALMRGATPQKSAPHSGQKNGSSVATQLKFSAATKPASHSTTATSSSSASTTTAGSKPLLSDEARQEKRQQQFNAGFKPKTAAAALAANSGKSHQDSPDGARRIVEQSRHKQHQILKGVRTNKRFELLMKFRDAAQD